MTKQELNRDIRRLSKMTGTEQEVRAEFLRLYRADDNFEYMNAESIRIMLQMNLRYRFIALHRFGLGIECNLPTVK